MLVFGAAAANDEIAVLEGLGAAAGLGFAGLAEKRRPDVCSGFLFAFDGTVLAGTGGS